MLHTHLLRVAHEGKDPALSQYLHTIPEHQEPPATGLPYVKPLVFGGLDGVCTVAAVLIGASAVGTPGYRVESIAFAQVLAGAVSMAMGEYLSENSRRAAVRKEMEREAWEIAVFPEGERLEMIRIYTSHGISVEDATEVAHRLSQYPDFWMRHHMCHELGIIPDGDEKSALYEACVMGVSFAAFGAAGMVAYACAHLVALPTRSVVSVCLCAEGLSLVILGVLRSRAEDANIAKSIAQTVLQGAVAAVAALIPSLVAPIDEV